MFAPTAYHRGGRAPFGWFGILCTSRNLSLLFLLLFRSSSPCSGPHAISLSRVSGSRGGGAESHTYSPHDARGMRIRALKFRQRTSIPLGLFIHSALANPPKEWLRNMTTRCCCLFPKMNSHIASATVMHRPTDRYFIVVISKSAQYDFIRIRMKTRFA